MRILALFIFLFQSVAFANTNEPYWGAIKAPDRDARSKLANLGFSIEAVRNDVSYGFANLEILEKLREQGFEIKDYSPAREIRALDFPGGDSIYHNYERMNRELDRLAAERSDIVHKFSLGKTGEGREIVGIRISPHAQDGLSPSALPGVLFLGGHHAREHLSIEMPILLAQFLVESRDEKVLQLLNGRDIFIVPMVNPDGAEFDISTGSYQMWRKNRTRNSGSSCMGVDINRNYGFQWGTGGSSSNPCSDTFMGPRPFSEPETAAIKNFVEAHLNIKTLLSFHSYSELVLYPWGHTYDAIPNAADRATFEKMASTMAAWNGYTPQPTHDLYIASGDTTDWAYGSLGIFAFTFELSPNGNVFGGGGFYPGAAEVQRSFQKNLKPALYLIDLADDPHRALRAPQTTLFYGI